MKRDNKHRNRVVTNGKNSNIKKRFVKVDRKTINVEFD
jgi:hypothetical protein